MFLYNKYDQYLEDLLCAQYNVADVLDHELAKGEVREDFLIKILKQCANHALVHKGFLSNGTDNSNQADIIVCKPTAHTRPMGTQTIIDVDTQPVLIEVKGHATGPDFEDFNIKAGRAKALCAPGNTIPCGIFCYRVKLTQATILKRFGYRYDTTAVTYVQDLSLPILYNNIDFAICINSDHSGPDKQFFLQKNHASGRYVYIRETPVIKHLISLVRSLTL